MTAPPRVLIVDDNEQNLKLTRIVLSQEGFDVRTAADATQALDALPAFDPHVILMDLQMPGMDGFELTRRLKNDAATSGIIIIALTAYAMKGDEQKAREAGCDGYLAKPIDTRSLGRLIREHVERLDRA